MPVVAPSSYTNQKAGGALENAAEEILNGIFCHYEPPISTKAQNNAANAVRKNPTKFLYEEQPTKPVLRRKSSLSITPRYATAVDFDAAAVPEPPVQQQQQQEEEEEAREPEMEREESQPSATEAPQPPPMDPETPSKKGVKWRDEESEREVEQAKKIGKSNGWSQCISIPCLILGGENTANGKGQATPRGLTDTQDENSVVHLPETPGAQTPSKSVLKKTNDMKVLYDDEGNPMSSTPQTPGSIKTHPFFRNVTNSPRVFEPTDYNNPTTPKSTTFQMHRDYTPRPPAREGSIANDENSAVQTPQVETLNKIGRASPRSPAWAPVNTDTATARSYVPKSPKSYMAASPRSSRPRNFDLGYESDGAKSTGSVMDMVQKLNKAGFVPGRKFQKGYSPKAAKSPSRRSDYSDVTMSVVNHHGYEAASANNDTRGSFGGEQQQQQEEVMTEMKRSFVGSRRVTAPTPLVLSNPSPKDVKHVRSTKSVAAAGPTPSSTAARQQHQPPTVETVQSDEEVRDAVEMARDPTPRQRKSYDYSQQALPPTPRRRTEQKPVQHFVPTVDSSSAVKPSDMNINKNSNNKSTSRQTKKKDSSSSKKKKVVQHQEEEIVVKSSSTKKKTESSRKKNGSGSNVVEKKNEKKGFMSGIKKGFGKLKSVVNEIDEQRLPSQTSSSQSNKKKSVKKDGTNVRQV